MLNRAINLTLLLAAIFLNLPVAADETPKRQTLQTDGILGSKTKPGTSNSDSSHGGWVELMPINSPILIPSNGNSARQAKIQGQSVILKYRNGKTSKLRNGTVKLKDGRTLKVKNGRLIKTPKTRKSNSKSSTVGGRKSLSVGGNKTDNISR